MNTLKDIAFGALLISAALGAFCICIVYIFWVVSAPFRLGEAFGWWVGVLFTPVSIFLLLLIFVVGDFIETRMKGESQ